MYVCYITSICIFDINENIIKVNNNKYIKFFYQNLINVIYKTYW